MDIAYHTLLNQIITANEASVRYRDKETNFESNSTYRCPECGAPMICVNIHKSEDECIKTYHFKLLKGHNHLVGCSAEIAWIEYERANKVIEKNKGDGFEYTLGFEKRISGVNFGLGSPRGEHESHTNKQKTKGRFENILGLPVLTIKDLSEKDDILISIKDGYERIPLKKYYKSVVSFNKFIPENECLMWGWGKIYRNEKNNRILFKGKQLQKEISCYLFDFEEKIENGIIKIHNSKNLFDEELEIIIWGRAEEFGIVNSGINKGKKKILIKNPKLVSIKQSQKWKKYE